MPFSGTFQAQNKNVAIPVLNNVLANVTWNSSAWVNYYNNFTAPSMAGILHEPVSVSTKNFYLIRQSRGGTVYGLSYSGTLFKLDKTTTTLTNLGISYFVTSAGDGSYSETGDKVFFTMRDEANGSRSSISELNLSVNWRIFQGSSNGDVWYFSESPLNTFTSSCNAIAVFNDPTASNAETAIVGQYKSFYKLRLPSGGGAQPFVQTSDRSSDLDGDIGSLNVLYGGLRMLVMTGNQDLIEYSFQTDGITNPERRYNLDWLQKINTINVLSLTNYKVTITNSLWCDRDDPYTSGIWVVDRSNRNIVQLDVNGTKYS